MAAAAAAAAQRLDQVTCVAASLPLVRRWLAAGVAIAIAVGGGVGGGGGGGLGGGVGRIGGGGLACFALDDDEPGELER